MSLWLSTTRTAIDIDDDLAIAAKKEAVERRTTLKELVEEGLRVVLQRRGGGMKDPVERLAGLGKDVWKEVDADDYVRDSRRGWE